MNLTRRTDLFCRAVIDELARIRKEAGLSQNQLAAPAGLNQSTINLMESGKTTPTVASLFRLADALGVSPAKVIEAALSQIPAKEQGTIQYPPITTDHHQLVAEPRPRIKRSPERKPAKQA